MAAAASVVIWQPSAPYTLYPLYLDGLWDAVTMMPAAQCNSRTAKDRQGVGMSSGYMCTVMPFAANTPEAVRANRSDLIRES